MRLMYSFRIKGEPPMINAVKQVSVGECILDNLRMYSGASIIGYLALWSALAPGRLAYQASISGVQIFNNMSFVLKYLCHGSCGLPSLLCMRHVGYIMLPYGNYSLSNLPCHAIIYTRHIDFSPRYFGYVSSFISSIISIRVPQPVLMRSIVC